MQDAHSNDLTQKIDAAFQRVAERVIERARQTRTPVIVWQDGRVVAIPYNRLGSLRHKATKGKQACDPNPSLRLPLTPDG